MSGKIHRWNAILVTQLKMPHKHREFNVESKNILGASMKANRKLKIINQEDKDNSWKIKSLY
tara:strand:- start:304 stop:489 length:186 start_codon:yes stop_codon:yes gene_type:complete